MTATAARIGFVLQETRNVVASDAAVKTRYGDQARDTGPEPVETFFDSTADAQAMANERLALLKADRRRFVQEVKGIQVFAGALDYSQVTPAVAVIDDERGANHPAAVVEIRLDFGADKTMIQSWG